jgi:8-oxo-dGTP pyrophosphatase MutT (NUDIX family)
MKANPWRMIKTKIVYENPWIKVREDEVIRPDGKPGIYGVVEIQPSVGIVALNKSGEIALVGQWRYTLKKYSWEIPTGVSHSQEDILFTAKRELQEETGLTAEEWTPLGTIDNCNGVTTDVARLFLARSLKQEADNPDPEEQISVRWIKLTEAIEEVMNDGITESVSVAGILRAAHILK